jgi:enediyne biosynthesis protein E7
VTGRPVPPGPPGRWPVGNSYDYDRDRIGFLRSCQARYGDVFSFSASTVFVGAPDLVHELFDKSNDEFMAEAPLFASAKDGARLERGIDGWMEVRKLGWQSMTRAVTRAHGARILADFDATLRSTEGREFDVAAVMRGYSSRMVADFLFGPGADDVIAAADVSFERGLEFMSTSLTIPRWLPAPSVRKTLRAEHDVIEAIEARLLARRRAPHAEPSDMLDLMADDAGLAEDDIVAILRASMLASFGSPGIALSWAIREMAMDAGLHRRLREEALGVLADGGSLTDDSQLPYSRAFVREILRLYPPTWLMGRVVRRDCTLGDWPLRTGQNIMFSPYLLHRDPRWWQDPDTVSPQRWLGRTAPQTRRAYLPFGSGPRMCLGLHLGLYQLVTCVSHLAAHYQVDSAHAAAVEPVPHAILLPRGLRARCQEEALSTLLRNRLADLRVLVMHKNTRGGVGWVLLCVLFR